MLSSALAMVETPDARSHRDDPPVFRGGQAFVPEVPQKRESATMIEGGETDRPLRPSLTSTRLGGERVPRQRCRGDGSREARRAPAGAAVIPPALLDDLAAGRIHGLDVAVITVTALTFATRRFEPRVERHVAWMDDGSALLVAGGIHWLAPAEATRSRPEPTPWPMTASRSPGGSVVPAG